MKVILLEELRGKGGEGDVIDVATGYAVNYLFPKKIAIEASKGNLKQLELRRHNIAKRETLRLDTADKLLEALEGKVVRIPSKVGEEGQLFGSVTTTQIAEALSALHNIEVDRKSIDTRQAIKSIGEHDVEVSIYRNIKATIQVLVVDEKAIEEEEPIEDDGVALETSEDVEVTENEAVAEDVEDVAADAEAESTKDDDVVEAAIEQADIVEENDDSFKADGEEA